MTKIIYLFSFVLFFLIFGKTPVPAQGLFPFPNEKGEWGYVDQNGQVKIKHQFAGAAKFHEDRAVVIKSKNNDEASFAVIDPMGNTIFEFSNFYNPEPSRLNTMDDLYRYREGLLLISAPVDQNYSYEVYTYYDKQGKIALKLNSQKKEYTFADSFSEGLAFVYDSDNGFIHYINQKGEKIISRKDEMSQFDKKFYSGMTMVYQNEKIGLINKEGKVVDLKSQVEVCEYGSFQEGFALVVTCWVDDSKPTEFKIMDTKGNTKPCPYYVQGYTPVTSVNGYVFSEGLMWIRYSGSVEDENKKIGYINTDGKIVFDLPKELSDDIWLYGGNFEGGLACWVKNSSGDLFKCYYIDKQGKIVLQSPEYRLD